YYLPFNTVSMLVSLLFSNITLSFLINLAQVLVLLGLVKESLSLIGVVFIGSMLSGFVVLDKRKRMEVIRAGFFVGIIQAGLYLLFIEKNFLLISGWLLNGLLSAIVVLGILPIFEFLFRTITNITLLELADFNHPLLQKLVLEAPGTYHHSLIVGNLSENAAKAINANSLLARIGAYYHDIGKLSKPEYFSENQVSLNESKHENLHPNVSKLVIMNHVKEGLSMAKKYHLHPRIIDFILQHHGTSLVYYFYRRALENLTNDNESLSEETFRYPGPKPQTKETAIVLLADSVEAAVRTLREPSASQIRDMVHKIINNKFIDGQLDECDLTLRDLEKIASVFIHILTGIYHKRIVYPEEKP
ncbi:MAG: HDIG domain-containing protein, partial [Candidatus Omnitrophica bacterium]|nr:HDIG domain-containing protein [Candidatus Omnitrophota bacterium]